jgi:parallel beta-helix repeat protein
MTQGLHQFARSLGPWLACLSALVASTGALALGCETTTVSDPGTTLTLEKDIVCGEVGDVGITVAADDVTIDLDGHTISGFKKEKSVGIRVDGHTDVRILNGTIEFFERGLFISNANRVDVTNVVSRGNRKDGIRVQSGMEVGLVNNEVLDNTNGIVVENGSDIQLLSNEAHDNSNVSFNVSGATAVKVANNQSSGGEDGFRFIGPGDAIISANQVKNFKGYGFKFGDTPGIVITTDGGRNKAKGKPSKACFPDPCPLDLK